MAAIGTPGGVLNPCRGDRLSGRSGGRIWPSPGRPWCSACFDGFLLLAVPLFIVSANIMNGRVDFGTGLLNFWHRSCRDGSGVVWGTSMLSPRWIFSGMSGSAVADAAGIGKIIIEMMVKSGKYTRGLCSRDHRCDGHHRAPIIPPSIPDGDLRTGVWRVDQGPCFLGGIISRPTHGGPVLMALNVLMSHRPRVRTRRARCLCGDLPRADRAGRTPALLMPIILLFCLYSGITTPTEAAAIAALYALGIAAGLYRAIKLKTLYQVFVDSAPRRPHLLVW